MMLIYTVTGKVNDISMTMQTIMEVTLDQYHTFTYATIPYGWTCGELCWVRVKLYVLVMKDYGAHTRHIT